MSPSPLARLASLETKAHRAPWVIEQDQEDPLSVFINDHEAEEGSECIAHMGWYPPKPKGAMTDASLVCTLRNNLPLLLDLWRAAAAWESKGETAGPALANAVRTINSRFTFPH